MVKCYIPEYPRPQFVRSAWENLNGSWDFAYDDNNIGERDGWFRSFPQCKTIQVPFTYETSKSGIGEEAFHPFVWYSRVISPVREPDKRVRLNLEGSDYFTKVWVNGVYVGCHTGGYTRFSFDITDALTDSESIVTIKVEDSNDIQQPRGKQRWIKENFGCWYVQTTGIWKSVWLEYLRDTYLEKVKMTPVLSEQALLLEWQVAAEHYGDGLTLEAIVSFDGILVNRALIAVLDRRGKARIDIGAFAVTEWGIKTWSPGQPNLYDISFRLRSGAKVVDEVGSYFGMREIRIENSNLLLNGTPLYQRMILDQGYWKDSHLTPPCEAAIIADVEKMMEMGFNGARKHQKIEDGRFAFWCDVKGLLLWCEMPSPYEYGDDMIHSFTEEWMDVVEQHYNHPSIITWTPFNESWGVPQIKTDRRQQHFTEAIYHLTKSIDSMRPVIVNDGWEHTISDILTLHDYEESGAALFGRYSHYKEELLENRVYHNGSRSAFANGYAYKGQPVMISEYGGAAFSGDDSTWGYGNKVDSVDAFLARLDDITTAVKKLDYVCGYCYTQVTDVQQEVNGLMDIDRSCKADVKVIRAINLKNEGCNRSGQ